jgi:hypothetical protein
MKKTYKKFITALVFTLTFQTLSNAQCYNYLLGATAVVTTSTPGTFVNVTNCNTAGEYNDITFSVPGVFSFSTSIPTDYITITDNFNNAIAAGFTPLYSVTIPSAGLYFFHISANGSCGSDPSCRVSDVFVPSPCSGLPNVGTVPASFSICPNTSALINVTGTTVGPGISYQWQEAPTGGGPWTNVTSGSGFNSFNFASAPLSTLTYYRFVVTCALSALSATSTVFSVNPNNPFTLCYCSTGLSGSGCGDFITNVSIPTTPFNNTSACSINAFGDTYSFFNPAAGATATLTAGANYSISITTNFNNIISVWIDYDHSGTFDVSEHTQVCLTSVAGIANTTVITIPATALTGQTGLRVRANGAGNPNGPGSACSPFFSGECEDYVITINSACTTPTIALTSSSNSVCVGSSAILTATGATTYSWNTGATTSTISVTPTTTTNYTVVGLVTGGCSNTKTISITATPLPTVSSVSSATLICSGQSATLTASGATNYTWTPGNLTTSVIVVSPSSTIIYTVVGAASSCTASAIKSVTVNPAPIITITPPSVTICVAGSPATLTANGGGTYSWTPANFPGTPNAQTVVVSPTVNTVYSVASTNSLGCSGTNTVAVLIIPCTGIANKSFVGENTTVYPNPTSGQLTVLIEINSGNYTFEVFDVAGKLVYKNNLTKAESQLTIKDLANGLYTYKITSLTTKQTVKQGKLIKE